MNAKDILKYGQNTVIGSIEGFPSEEWETAGVCGVWSARDVLAHLASYERVLTDVLCELAGENPDGALERYLAQGPSFNDTQVAERSGMTVSQVMEELSSAHTRNMELISRIPGETLRQPGTLPWYGGEYSLDDYIVYQFYGHKREHSAQMAAFLDLLSRGSARSVATA